jgi:hypothetical protein
MPSKHGSAQGKSTAQVNKKDNAQHKIESAHTPGEGPVKSGRNMGGRDVTGARVRTAQADQG